MNNLIRKIRTILLLALAFSLTGTAGFAGTPARLPSDLKYPKLAEFKVPKPERFVLDNGLVVLLLPNHDLPLVQGIVYSKVGSRLVLGDKIGLASIAGDVLRTGGTAKRSGDELDDLLAGIGASIETGIGEDRGSTSMSCLAEDLDTVLGLVAEILRTPAFDEGKIDVAKTGEKTGISRRNDDSSGIAGREFAKLVHGADSVYARQTEYATIDAISRDDIVAFHEENYFPNRTLIGLTGDFDPKTIRSILEKHFGVWKKGAAARPFEAPPATPAKPGIYYVEKSDVNQSNILLGHIGIRRDNPDFYAVTVFNEIFGGGFSSRLFSNVRSKKGLAYAVRGSVGSDYDHPGVMRIMLRTKSETTVEGRGALHEEIASILAEPPLAEEMDRAKSSILNSFIFNFDTRMEVLRRQLIYEYYGYPLDFLERYRKGIDKVTAKDVHRVAGLYLRPDDLVQLYVGNGAKFDKPLAVLGKVTAIDIAIPAPAEEATPEATSATLDSGKSVLSRAIKTIGGPALGKVKTLRSVGEMAMQTPMGEMAMRTTTVLKLPDHLRQEMKTPAGVMTMVVTPELGFMGMGPGSSRPMPEARRKSTLDSVARMLVVFLQSGDAQAQHLGSETLDGKDCDKILVTDSDASLTLWVTADGVIVQDSHTGDGPSGAPGKIVRVYDDWREMTGVKIPFKVVSTFDGEPMRTVTLESVDLNVDLEGSEFAQPE